MCSQITGLPCSDIIAPLLTSQTPVSSHTILPQDHNWWRCSPSTTPEWFSTHHRITSELLSTACKSLWVLTPNHFSNLTSLSSYSFLHHMLHIPAAHTAHLRRCTLSPAVCTLHLGNWKPAFNILWSWSGPNASISTSYTPDTASSFIHSYLSGLWAPEDTESSQLHAQ